MPVALEAVIMKAMAKIPDDRYRTAEELRADLLRFADGRPVEAGDPGVTSMMAAVGATQAVPTTTGRTMAVPADGGPPPANRDELERQEADTPPHHSPRRAAGRSRRHRLLPAALGLSAATSPSPTWWGTPRASPSQTLKNDNLTVGTTVVPATSSQAKGIVLSTNPAAGASVSKNSAVNLVVSNGPNVPIVTVPSVKGKQLTTAIQLIQGAGLTYKVNNVTSTQPVGTVLDQNPAGGAKVKATVPVVLTVSGTQSSVSVPSVLGQSPASAGSTLTQAGLNVGSQTNACSSQFAAGLVSAQSPAAGATVQPNTPVNLVVSNGSCVPVPNVVGQTQSAAQSAITAAGLVANTTTDTTCAGGAQSGNVDSQTPAANTQVANGSTVNISVCQSTATTTTTTTTPSTTTTTSTTSTSHAVRRRGG